MCIRMSVWVVWAGKILMRNHNQRRKVYLTNLYFRIHIFKFAVKNLSRCILKRNFLNEIYLWDFSCPSKFESIVVIINRERSLTPFEMNQKKTREIEKIGITAVNLRNQSHEVKCKLQKMSLVILRGKAIAVITAGDG